ncbi:MAG: barstar family protein [Elusimicrobia bacterium]|nr:barstar family protein [Elusimicrobiota bacterium]
MTSYSRPLSDRLADSEKEHVCCLSSDREREAHEAASRLGFLHQTIDLADSLSPSGIIEAFGKALEFPEPYGRNWDALIDCLRYLPDSTGYVLIVKSIDRLWKSDPNLYYKLTHILRDIGQESHSWKNERIPFKTILLTEDSELIRVVGCSL